MPLTVPPPPLVGLGCWSGTSAVKTLLNSEHSLSTINRSGVLGTRPGAVVIVLLDSIATRKSREGDNTASNEECTIHGRKLHDACERP
jgi:hypothetical protein